MTALGPLHSSPLHFKLIVFQAHCISSSLYFKLIVFQSHCISSLLHSEPLHQPSHSHSHNHSHSSQFPVTVPSHSSQSQFPVTVPSHSSQSQFPVTVHSSQSQSQFTQQHITFRIYQKFRKFVVHETLPDNISAVHFGADGTTSPCCNGRSGNGFHCRTIQNKRG